MPNENSYEVALQKSNAIREGLAKTPEKFTMLTGDRPTGRLHLGHYFGTLKGRVELQNMGAKTNVLIADYQVITDRDTTEHIQDNVYNMVMDYLACGIDPDKTMIYAHSAVPAANQLMLPFLSLVSEAELARNPTVKAEMEASGHELTGLLLTYPVHQACDILFCKGNVVPVGKDQLPHIEQTRQIARRFNERYGRVLPEPHGLLTDAVEIPGLDGRKMSKSYGNYIGLTDEAADMFGKVMSIPDELMVKYYRLASTEAVDEIDRIEAGLAADELHPNKVKRALARNIVAAYYDDVAAEAAEADFDLKFKEHGFPADAPIFAPDLTPDENGLVYVAKILVDAGVAGTASEARRLIDGGGVKIDGEFAKAAVGDRVAEAGMKAGLFKSISEARKTIKAGGVYLNNARVKDEEQVLNENDFLHGRFALIRRGKKALGVVENV